MHAPDACGTDKAKNRMRRGNGKQENSEDQRRDADGKTAEKNFHQSLSLCLHYITQLCP